VPTVPIRFRGADHRLDLAGSQIFPIGSTMRPIRVPTDFLHYRRNSGFDKLQIRFIKTMLEVMGVWGFL
jgi:hypothetical protein